MGVFAVFLQESLPQVRTQISNRIQEQYPNPKHYKLSDNLFLVRSYSITDAVARSIGIKGDEAIEHATGVVFKLNAAYAGFAKRAIWEWLALPENE